MSAPDVNFTREALDKLEFYAVIDFFLSESAQHADIVLPGSLHEEDEGTSTSGEGRIIKINAAVTPPGEARRDWEILLDIAQRLGKSEYFPYTNTEQIFDELCRASSGGTADYTGATWQRVEDEMGLFWPIPEAGHPGTPRLHEGGQFHFPDGRARFHGVPYKLSAEVVDDEYPVLLTTGRVVSQYLSGTQTRRIAALVAQYPEPLCEMHPSSPNRSASPTATCHRHLEARQDHAAGARRQHDPAGHRLHSLPLARSQGREPVDEPRSGPVVEDARVQGRCRSSRTSRRAHRNDRRT